MRTVAFIVFCLALAYGERGAAERRTKSAPVFEGAAPSEETESPEAPAQDDDDLHESGQPVASDEARELLPGECAASEVALRRSGEQSVRLRLTDCHGEARLDALSALSELARPLAAAKDRAPENDKTHAALRQLNPELLVRLQHIADQFPEHAIEIVSGYRPSARLSSRHRSADALDIRVEGVENQNLSEFARSLPSTGVGYYPNSSFVHIDVRAQAFYWVDNSAPGEAPHYAQKDARANATEQEPEPQNARGPAQGTTPSADASTAIVPSQPSAASEQGAAGDTDAELRGLAERALFVMNLALGRSENGVRELPARQTL